MVAIVIINVNTVIRVAISTWFPKWCRCVVPCMVQLCYAINYGKQAYYYEPLCEQ